MNNGYAARHPVAPQRSVHTDSFCRETPPPPRLEERDKRERASQRKPPRTDGLRPGVRGASVLWSELLDATGRHHGSYVVPLSGKRKA